MGVKMKAFRLLPLNMRVWLFERKLMDRPWPYWYKENYRVLLDKAYETFLTEEDLKDKKKIRELTHDVVRCWLKYEAMPNEYFLYDMRNSDERKRATFLTDVLKDKTCIRCLDRKTFDKEIKDKYAFYQLMKPFFGRKVFQVNSFAEKESFVSFAMETKSLFCKLEKGSRGKGAFVAEVSGREDAERLFGQLSENHDDEWIVEERIRQSQEMAQWNESSVNTVRLPSFLTKSGFKVLAPFFRTGRLGSVIDNAGQGGVFAVIDPVSGVLITDGVDEVGGVFPSHPDSKIQFKGWQVPKWNELLQVAEKAHRIIPHQKYIGWDFALTDNGWRLIEGNWGQMVGQYATKKGVKDEFLRYMQD